MELFDTCMYAHCSVNSSKMFMLKVCLLSAPCCCDIVTIVLLHQNYTRNMLYQRQLVLMCLWCVSSVYIEVEYFLMIDKGIFKACLSTEVTAYQK